MKTLDTTIDIDATPAKVWETLIDFPSHEQWNPFFARIEGEPRVGQSITITARKPDGSGGMSFTPTILDAEPAKLLRWRGKLFIKGLFDGEHTFQLVDLGNGQTRLNHGEKFSGILIPVMGKVLFDTEKGFMAFNQALAEEVTNRLSTEPSS